MATLREPSANSPEPIWARLRRIDPPGDDESDGKFSPIDLKLAAGSLPKGTILKDEKTLYHTIKSQDLPGGNSFSINSNIFIIGRANTSHLSIRSNKLVSGNHCRVLRDDDGNYWIEDTSTNGTLINKTRKIVKEKIKLEDGDIIHLVFKNNATAENLGFKFELANSGSGDEATQLDDDTLEDIIEIEPEDKDAAKPSCSKRQASPSFDDSSEKKQKVEEEEDDEIGETLICIICQDIFHDCVSLQPCMHSYCSGCYSEWMATSNECPCCRLKVDRISKNHLVNNLVESYLKKNPNKKRSEDDLKELDAKNKITHDMLYKKMKRSHHSDSEGSSSHSENSSRSPSPTPPMPAPSFVNYNPAFARNMPTFGAPRTVCRQCPGAVTRTASNASSSSCASACAAADAPTPAANPAPAAPAAANPAPAPTATTPTAAANPAPAATPVAPTAAAGATPAGGDGAGPSTSDAADAKSTPQAPDFVCRQNQNHILCMCCLQAMPDRRTDLNRDPNIPKQQCTICYKFFCHAYWTCPKADCLGCLGKFRDMNFGRKCLTSIVLENPFESKVLSDYLGKKNISVRDMLNICITKMEAFQYFTTDSNRGVLNGDTVVCYPCGLRNFQELAYSYRRDVNDADLPAAVTSRANCYWGKGCRTQKHKPHHAAKLNHICNATRR